MTTKPSPRYWPTLQGRDCYDWISAEDVIRHALSAYYTVCREHDQYPDDPQPFDLLHKHGRRELAEAIGELFGMKLMDQGFRVSAPGFSEGAAIWLANRYDQPKEGIADPEVVSSGPDFPILQETENIHRAQYKTEGWHSHQRHRAFHTGRHARAPGVLSLPEAARRLPRLRPRPPPATPRRPPPVPRGPAAGTGGG